jgi:cation diffusion facilitator family transporter
MVPMARAPDLQTTKLSVVVSFTVNLVETLALAVAAWVTGSVALRAQTAANAADVAVAAFLLVGVLSSARPADEGHPLGYGRESFFWSLFAALGIAIGGAGFALSSALSSLVNPERIDSYALAYVVLAVTIAFDALALAVALRPLRRHAAARGISLRAGLRRTTDAAAAAVVVAGGCAVIGGLTATVGLVLSQVSGSPLPDTIASALIGLLLLAASGLLLRTNRELLTGRGVPPAMLADMRRLIAAQPGILDVPDLLAVVVGPASLIVNGDVTFADDLNVPAVEQAIADAASALRERYPMIEYVNLTPVPRARPRRARRAARTAP